MVPAQVWADLPGDWSSGSCYRANRTDVGANLQWLLERNGLAWTPLRRSHSLRDHTLLYGIYSGVLYHHGAGFRGLKPPGKGRTGFEPKQPDGIAARQRMQKMQADHPERFKKFLDAAMETSVESEAVYDEIVADPHLFERILAG